MFFLSNKEDGMEGASAPRLLDEDVDSTACQTSIRSLAAIYFVPRLMTRRGIRKRIEYERRFESVYQSPKVPPHIRGKILATLLDLFVEQYASCGGQGSLQTHLLDSAKLRREEWIRNLRGIARVSRVNDEWRIVWSETAEQITVHATCRHQDLYSTE